jgi:pimeloyl-ACP methyl ester carboxylesterase
MARELTAREKFLVADYETQRRLLAQPAIAADIGAWLGREALEQLAKHGVDAAHLSAGPKNLIFVPGVMGSTLLSVGLGGVWWIDMAFARDKLNGLALAADGTRDADGKAEISAAGIDVSYVPFRRAVAVSGRFGGSEQFPYDWRKSLRASADALRDQVLRCHAEYGEPVHLVGHSMGGLMIRTALMLHGDALWPKLGKIVFIGTPHYGSPSIAGYLKNHLWGWEAIAVLSLYISRETFRSMRGVLSLLPAPPGIYPGTGNREAHPCANFDMYDAVAWKLDLDAAGTAHLQSVLDEVSAFHTDLYRWHDTLLQEKKDRMLMIAGVGQKTLFRLEFDTHLRGAWETTKKITDRIPGDPNRDGDQRVPVASARLEDVAIRYVEGAHGGLPNIPAVARDVLAFLAEESLKLPDTPQGALGAHLSADDAASPAPALDGSAEMDRFRDLPDYKNPTPDFRKRIEDALGAGQMPQVNLARIL